MVKAKGLVIILCILIGINLLFLLRDYNHGMQQFSWLADGFLSGHLYAVTDIPYDMVSYDGHLYWPQGPFPAVLIIPFKMLLGDFAHQGLVQILLFMVILTGAYALAKIKGYSRIDSLVLASVFCFGSVMSGLLSSPSSWYFSQVVAVAFSLVSIWIWKKYKSPLCTGLFCALVVATRPIAAAFLVVIMLEIASESIRMRDKILSYFYLLLPVVIVVILLAVYNFERFGDPFNNGYLINNIDDRTRSFMNYGLFNIRHILRNGYWYFMAPPHMVYGISGITFPYIQYDEWGLSLLFVQPFFFFALRTISYKGVEMRTSWLVVCASLIALLMYFNTGWSSLGPRYTADFLPILYVILLGSFVKYKLSNTHKVVALMSICFNTYLIFSTYVYPSLH